MSNEETPKIHTLNPQLSKEELAKRLEKETPQLEEQPVPLTEEQELAKVTADLQQFLAVTDSLVNGIHSFQRPVLLSRPTVTILNSAMLEALKDILIKAGMCSMLEWKKTVAVQMYRLIHDLTGQYEMCKRDHLVNAGKGIDPNKIRTQ